MKIATRISTVLALVAFVVALSFPLATSAEPGPAPAKPAVTRPVPPPAHPEIEDAMRLLKQAQDHLNHASHDFGGHRENAMNHISKAMEELHAAIEYADHHH
ncbi:MAG TPA: hypothetical protein VKB26_09220 [Candidatus Acidoferrales bacterium]|nr:hypothetical protein [Candidatus Acidoferrales bacterium]